MYSDFQNPNDEDNAFADRDHKSYPVSPDKIPHVNWHTSCYPADPVVQSTLINEQEKDPQIP